MLEIEPIEGEDYGKDKTEVWRIDVSVSGKFASTAEPREATKGM